MAYVTSSSGVKVAITTRMHGEGQTIVTSKLWPETDLSVVNAVTEGGIYINGNTIGLDASSQNLVSSSGMEDWVGSHYCPLEKTIQGSTQYADMFIYGGTAVVVETPSVGYGTLSNEWSVMNYIPSPPFDSAVSKSLPTVPAVASAIDGAIYGMTTGISGAYVKKTDSATPLSQGIVIVPESHGLSISGGTLSMNVATVVGNYTDAATLVTAGNAGGVVVMNTITGATTGQENLAVTPTVNAVAGAIDAEGERLTVWVRNNFLSSTYVPPAPSIGYAGYGTYGLAAVQRYSGIVVTDGVLTLDKATTTQIGGVVVKSSGGLDVTGGTVSLHKATTTQLGGVIVPAASGLSITGGTLSLDSATTTQIGGVVIKESGGLAVTGGTLSVASAPVFATIESALQSTQYGGVQVIAELKQPTSDTEDAPIIPNYNVVWNAVYGYSGDFTCTYHAGTNSYITTGSGIVYINGTSISYSVTPTGQVAASGDGYTDVWLNITYNASNQNPFSASISSSRATTAGTQSILLAKYDPTGAPTRYHKGPVVWDVDDGSGDGGTAYFGDFKVSCAGAGSTISVAGGFYYMDGNNTSNTINSVSCSITGATTGKTLWLNITSGSTVGSATITPLMGSTVYSVPLAYVIGSTVCQYQLGPVVIRGRWT